MKKSNLPPSYLKFTGQFYDSIFERHPSQDDAILIALPLLDRVEQNELRTFVAAILNDGTSDADLSRVWMSGNADIWVNQESIRLFFETLLDALDRNLPEP